MSNPNPNPKLTAPEDHRPRFDLNEYERIENQKRRERQAAEEEDAPKKKIRKEPLKARDAKLDLESRVGKTVIITKTTPLSQAGGFYCDVCDCVIKDSINYLDHINGRKHQKNLGHSMKTQRSTIDDIKAKLKAAKEKTEEQLEEYDLEERLQEAREEEEKAKEYRREKARERKQAKKLHRDDPVDEEYGPVEQQDMAEMMGFGGFGGSKK